MSFPVSGSMVERTATLHSVPGPYSRQGVLRSRKISAKRSGPASRSRRMFWSIYSNRPKIVRGSA